MGKSQLGWYNPSMGTSRQPPKDQRYKAAYLFAAACPETNKSATLVLPHAMCGRLAVGKEFLIFFCAWLIGTAMCAAC